jgi:hypothetical protein
MFQPLILRVELVRAGPVRHRYRFFERAADRALFAALRDCKVCRGDVRCAVLFAAGRAADRPDEVRFGGMSGAPPPNWSTASSNSA